MDPTIRYFPVNRREGQMKRMLFVFGIVICSLLVPKLASASPATSTTRLAVISKRFNHPQFISNNDDALTLRLALLDHAAKGALVRIATYTYDDGKATHALAKHMCSAVGRGVHVELIVDSKSGEIAGEDNPFNGTAAAVKTEQAYANLANCGVSVFIHNYTTEYANVMNKRIPNIFAPELSSGEDATLRLTSRLEELRERLSANVEPALRENGMNVGAGSVLKKLQSLTEDLGVFFVHQARTPSNPSAGPPSLYKPSDIGSEKIAADYRDLLSDPFWEQFDPADRQGNAIKMAAITKAIISALEKDDVLRLVRNKLRVYNRLAHRKLFLVQEPPGPGSESCVIIGGRNLGDNYLTSGHGSYRDGDVFFCKRQVPTMNGFLRQANESLDQLRPGPKQDLSDPVLHSTNSNVLKQVEKRGVERKASNRTAQAVDITRLKGDDLEDFVNPVLLTSGWNPKTDEVHQELVAAIGRETKEIYIETAYAEFDKAIREALESAMRDRHVKVRVVTNSLFISDGIFQLIRVWMVKWNEKMAHAYPALFEIDYAPLSAGHMIHFKGAAFRCQNGIDGGSRFRQYMVGSHNFHPRSGYSDKEHEIEWRVEDPDCRNLQSDLITSRIKYYNNAQKSESARGRVLVIYSTFLSELHEVADNSQDTLKSSLAQAIEQAMHMSEDSQIKVTYEDKLNLIQMLLDEGGLRDLIGMLL
jgi:phosphatidylserine/phosphatidylglycerophosphate/cardiolipin synthase-like enzyme